MEESAIIPTKSIEQHIFLIRGHKVMLDVDLARLYQVKTKVLNQAVKRNIQKFPEDFMFQLTRLEMETWLLQSAITNAGRGNRSQFVTGSQKHRDPHSLPYAFTEHGALMAANVLRSERAVRISVYIVRAFVKLRETLAMHKELAQKLAELDRKVGQHDADIQRIVDAIRQLMAPAPVKPKRPIGFRVEEARNTYRTRSVQHSCC